MRIISKIETQMTFGFLLAGLLFVTSCSSFDPLRAGIGSYRNYTEIKGKIEDEKYISPLNNFSCVVPPLLKPGALIRDDFNQAQEMGSVGFEDDLGTLIRVDYFATPKEKAQQIETVEGRKATAQEVFDFTVEQMYRPVAPKTTVTHTEFVELQGGTGLQRNVALFGIALLPKGSNLSEATKGRYDALRASLVFVRGKFVYVLTVQDIPGHFGVTFPEEENKKRLLKKLEEFYGTFSFS